MSKFKLHPISAIIHFIKSLKDMLVPLLIIVVANGFNFSIDFRDEHFFSNMLPLFIILLVLIITLVNGIIKWLTFNYWFEDQELRIQYGLFVKKRRFIPFDRIQTLNYKEGIFHRPFGLVQVTVETAGSAKGKAEAEFTAISKQAATQIEQEMNEAKGKMVARVEVEQHGNIVFKMSAVEQMLLATTSGGIGVIIFGVLAVASQFIEYIPVEHIFDQLSYLLKYGFMFVTVLVFICLVIAWMLSVVWTMISYFDFKVAVEQERIVITRGLLEKKRIMIPLNRVQAVQIHENPLRQLFGFASVKIESAGGGEGDKGLQASVRLFPLIKKKNMVDPLQELFPHLDFSNQAQHAYCSPQKARPFFYRLNFLWFVPAVVAASYFLFPYGLLTILIGAPVIIIGIWRHKTAQASLKGNQIAITYRTFGRVTFIAEKQRIQAMTMRQTFFQKRRDIASVVIHVKSGAAGSSATAYHMQRGQMERLLGWYEHSDKPSNK